MGATARISIISILFFATANASANCGSAFCSINTNSEIQFDSKNRGFGVNLRYEFVDLDQPREGTNKIGARGEPGGHDEIETTNHNLVLGFDYAFDQHWAIGLQLPFLKRTHTHIHNPSEEEAAEGDAPERETWNFSGIGDVRTVARYQTNLGDSSVGFQAGVKLPTGARDGRNDSGELAERTLQLGTGSTDLIVGGFAKGNVGEMPLRWFIQTQWQHAIATKDDFRPADDISLDVGLRYFVTDAFSANLQLNSHFKRRDRGANAEPDESGGKYLYLSPGVSYAFGGGLQGSFYVQVPLYQNVNGIQLTQSTSYVAGLSYRF
jgi:Putative MetA-pathway of phenol degradation